MWDVSEDEYVRRDGDATKATLKDKFGTRSLCE